MRLRASCACSRGKESKVSITKMINDMIGKKVIVRGSHSGVFFGTLKREDGQRVVMRDVRNLWYWSGAANLLQLAAEGVKYPNRCKFSREVETLVLLDVVEIVPCTDDAVNNINAVEVWTV